MSFFEIIGAPLTVWIAPAGTDFPTIAAAPASPWLRLGTNGDRNYDVAGVEVQHSKTYNKVRTAGATGPVTVFLDEEDVMFRLSLLDMTIEQYAHALNNNTVTTVAPAAGQPGHRAIGLSEDVGRTAQFALLARGLSPYNPALAMQYEIPRCFQSGAPNPIFRKGQPAALQLTYEALENASAVNPQQRLGVLRQAHLPAL